MDEAQALQLAREAIRQGNKATAQRLLRQIIQTNPQSEIAWLLLSVVAGDPAKERDCLERVLAINPHNATAQRHLARLNQAQAPLSQVAQQPTTAPQTSSARSQVPQEIVLFSDGQVQITSARAVFDDKTYAMANITSVSRYRRNPRRALPVLLAIAGALLAASGLLDETQSLCSGLGALMLFIGIAWLITEKTTYHVRIGSASGESDVLGHRDAAYIDSIVEAMNEAIVKRG